MSTPSETDLQPTELTTRDAERTFRLATNRVHRFVLRPLRARVLEVEDVHFHFDSAVMMPDFDAADPADANQVTGLAILRTAYMHAQNSADRLLLAGHTDRSGATDYNVELSRSRSSNVLHLLLGNRSEWVASSESKHQTEDIQQILKWVDRTFGWGCDPGPVDNRMGPATRRGISTFQERYNQEFDPDVRVTGAVDTPTWGAFFDVYMRGLKDLLGTDEAGLATLRARVRFVSDAQRAVGCGESHPVSANTRQNQRSEVDRRVEMLFFEPDELPRLDCHPGVSCDAARCEIYGPKRIFSILPIPVATATLLIVHLRLEWRDPTDRRRPFPVGMPVTVVFGENEADTFETQVGDDGRITFPVDRSKRSFTLRFRSANALSVSSHRPGAGGPEEEQLAFDPELAGHMDGRRQVYLLPRDWSLRTSDWTRDGAPMPPDGSFSGLEDPTVTVGSPTAPVVLTLDPHWQFVRLVYFDRFLRAKKSLLRGVLEGFRNGADLDASPGRAPDTRSNWTIHTDDEARQCLPWILQRDPAGAPVPKPDASAALRYRTAPGTFIESSAPRARRLVSLKAENPAGTNALRVNDPGINAGLEVDFDLGTPSPGRMRFYDLPLVWKSRGQFARRSVKDNTPTPSDGVFENLAAQPTSNAEPLIFSLDDLVLTDDRRTPIAWNPSQPGDRIALFSHTFSRKGPDGVSDDPALSEIGLYKADASEPYFSQQVARLAEGINQIVDYPDWTRLVVAKGDLYEVFDQRIQRDGPLVGARAAVRWEESMRPRPGQVFLDPLPAPPQPPVATPDGRPLPGTHFFPRPGPVGTPFYVIQPFYEQRQPSLATHPRGLHKQLQLPSAENLTTGTGRFDVALLRCTDIDGDNEKALCLSYLRLHINFDPTFPPGNGETGFPANAFQPRFEGARATAWRRDFIDSTTKRWNGPDASPLLSTFFFNPGPPQIMPANPSAMKLSIDVRTLVQHVPKDLAHIEAGVFRKSAPNTIPLPAGTFKPGVRASMGSDSGRGTFDVSHRSAGPDGESIPAHECGHALSLSDEYAEGSSASCFAYGLPGIFSYTPGAPFSMGGPPLLLSFMTPTSLMAKNFLVLARHYWQLAEWTRSLLGVDFRVRHAGHDFALRHHPLSPKRSFVSWPINESIDTDRFPRGRFDAFFQPLGDDVYLELGQGSPSPKGIVAVLLKFRVKTDTTVRLEIEQAVTTLQNAVFSLPLSAVTDGTFYLRANGSVEGEDASPSFLTISPRFLVETLAADPAYQAEVDATDQATYQAKVDRLELEHRVHFHVEIRRSGGNAFGALAPPGTPRLVLSLTAQEQWPDFIGEMLGIAPGKTKDKQSYLPLFQTVMTHATMV